MSDYFEIRVELQSHRAQDHKAEISHWLQHNIRGYSMHCFDMASTPEKPVMLYAFSNRDAALMFKLAWGGK